MDATTIDWYETAGRLLLAAALGGMLGAEREYDGQDAGFRTHVLVVLGSALFSVASVGAFGAFEAERAATNVTVDVTRIASYVAPGVGFIGGGAILKYGGRVSGITTAGSLWTAAAIGVAAGLGLWIEALVTTVIALVTLEALAPLGARVQRAGLRRRSTVALAVDGDVDLAGVIATVRDHAEIRALRYGEGPGDTRQVTIDLWRSPTAAERDRIVAALAAITGVTALDEASDG